MGVLSYLKSLFYRPDIEEYLNQNPFYANGCEKHFNDSIQAGIVQKAIVDAQRELVLPGSNLGELLDALFLGGQIGSLAWHTYSAAIDEDELAIKRKDPRFQKKMEEEIIAEIMQQT